jgi:hypothetical protein
MARRLDAILCIRVSLGQAAGAVIRRLVGEQVDSDFLFRSSLLSFPAGLDLMEHLTEAFTCAV